MSWYLRSFLTPGVAALLASGCLFGELDLSTRHCPCADGFTCVGDRCVRGGDDDAGAEEDAGFDAGTGDAGPPRDAGADPDTGPGDAGAPITSCDGVLAGALFCESFEDPDLPQWPAPDVLDGTVAHTTMMPYLGTGALRASNTAVEGYGELVAPVLGGVSSGDLYLRAYVRVPAGPAISEVSLLHVGLHRSAVESPITANAFASGAGLFVPAFGKFQPGIAQVPRDEWFCLQLYIHLDATGGIVRTFIDGDVATELLDIDTTQEAPYTHVGVGLAWSDDAQENLEVFFDEVAVGTTELPCDLP